MDKKEDDECSPLISVLPKLAGNNSSKPDKQSTQDDTERNSIEGINEAMI
jgi:hypothetical protein